MQSSTNHRKWCQYLARGGRMTRAGIFHCVTRNAGHITASALNDLEAQGFITLEPTLSDTPQLRHVRAQLTEKGYALANLIDADMVPA